MREAESGQGTEWRVDQDAAMIQKLLKFTGGFFTPAKHKVSLAADVSGIEEPTFFELGWRKCEIIRSRGFENFQRLRGIAMPDSDVSANRRQPVAVDGGIQWILFFEFC